ncbi:MAG: DeoR family transcriptional regulator [Phycisphaera sp.]|nr:DeoR family transcriptional regulator [Phycisphaera sp.]
MLIVERQDRVLSIVRQRKAVQLDDLARELEVSSSTIRRDLEVLEERGLVSRTHGGAVYSGAADDSVNNATLAQRMAEHVEQKQAIAHLAASMVKPYETVLFDGGSTVIYAARLITARPIQVVTNSVSIAGIFSDDEKVELVHVGGALYPRAGVTVGPIATGCLAELHADVLFFSLAGIYEDAGYNINLAMAQVEQVMMRQATRSVMLMDSSKFGRKSLTRVCGLDEVDQIVTDEGVPEVYRERLGQRLLVVG